MPSLAHTLLFADVVDSTALVERLGDTEAAELWATHDRVARRLLAEHAGQEIDRADGFFLLFSAVPAALGFAAAYHAALKPLGLAARVGLHHGEVELRHNLAVDVARGAKLVEASGLAKPLAARVMSLARGGQTLLSAEARAALGDTPRAALTLQSHGHYKLKGIQEPQVLFEAGLATSAFVPPADTEKAWRVVQRDGLWVPLRDVPHNLAPERDAFIGRTAELRALAQRLEHGARHVTVTGVGGTGKTRLVRRYALAWLGEWPGGVYFCDLSEARSVEGICRAVALALSVPLGRDDPVMQLGHALAARGRCLLILDNFEQVVAHAAATLGHWLDRATEAHGVVTSRELLRLPAEQVLALEPLPVSTEGVELFTARARAQQPAFVAETAVAELVKLLDGLPLAIELAAARIRVLQPEQMLARLRDRFALLSGTRGAAGRQATLRAAIDWSWELLAPWEQAALAEAAVFEGGFTIDAAEAVLDLSAWRDAPPVIDVVRALVDKSLLRTWVPTVQATAGAPDTLFGMLISIHEYASAKLDGLTLGAAQRAHRRHGQHYASFGSPQAIDAMHRTGGAARRDRLTLQLENLIAACSRAADRGDAEVALPCYRAAWLCLSTRGPLSMAVALGDRVLGIASLDAASRVGTLSVQAEALRQSGQLIEAHQAAADALDLATTAADGAGQAAARSLLARILVDQGNPEEALALQETALAQYQRDGNRLLEGRALLVMGSASQLNGQMQRAREYDEAALTAAQQTGDASTQASAYISLGMLDNDQSEFDAALAHYAAGLVILRALADRTREATMLMNIANVYNDRGDNDTALAHYDQALVLAREVGHRGLEGSLSSNLANVRLDQGRLTEAEALFDQAIALHRERGNHRAVAIALCNQCNLLRRLQRYDDAMRGSDEALQIARAGKLRRVEAYALVGQASVLLDQRQPQGVRHRLEAARVLLHQVGDRACAIQSDCLLGELDVQEGQPAAGAQRLVDAEEAARGLGIETNPDVMEALGRLRAALGRA